MAIIQLVQEAIALVEGILSHFVSGGGANAILANDYEWSLETSQVTLDPKGMYLSGAVADIVTYGAILVDWLIQALLSGGNVNVNVQATP